MTKEIFSIVWMIVGTALAVLTVIGTLELLILTLCNALPARRKRDMASGLRHLRIAVVIPAHNEELNITRCVKSLLMCDQSKADFTVNVVADNCTDATAELALAAGAHLLVRHDPEHRGKGYALDFAFRALLKKDFDAVIVVDADTVVEANLISEFAQLFASGADAVQSRYTVNNPNASNRTRLMHLALMAFNILRPRGRDRLGWSAGLLGNGFGLTRATLNEVPYTAVSVVEDLEYHLRLVSKGYRVWFADKTTVRADMPVMGKGVKTQRARWEGGRLRMLASQAPQLAKRVMKGELGLLEPLMELMLLPLAFHVFLLVAALVPPFAPSRIYAGAGLFVVALHVLVAIPVGGGGMQDLATLATAPFYIIWKLAMLPKLLWTSRRGSEWVRTERVDTQGGKA